MAKIKRSFTVAVPIEKVFAYLSDFTKLTEWLPSLTNVRGISGNGINQCASWTYEMMNRSFRGELVCTEYSPNERLVMKTTGGIPSTWHWTLKPAGSSTQVNMEIKYDMPIWSVGFLSAGLALIENKQDANTVVTNIKHNLESQGKVKFL